MRVEGLPRNSIQADLALLPILETMGCTVGWDDSGVVVERDDLRLLDTHAVPWGHSDSEAGVRVQALTPGEVEITYAPPGTRLALTSSALGGEPASGFVLTGSLTLDGGVTLSAGCFAREPDGEDASGVAGEIGCRILRF